VETLAREGHGTKRVCRLLQVAPSGFFRRRSKAPADRAIRRAWLTDVIAEIRERSRRTYGYRRMRAELADAYGQQVNKKLIQAIMRELGISGLPRRRKAIAPPATPPKARSVNLRCGATVPHRLPARMTLLAVSSIGWFRPDESTDRLSRTR
jgi:hypothetical protein